MERLLGFVPDNCRNWSALLLGALLLSLIAAIVLAVTAGNWQSAFLAGATIIFILLPFALAKQFDIYVPRVFSFALALFVYATLFLGEANRFYYDVWWWDVMLHSGSAFAFGLLGLIVLMLSVSKQTITAKPIVLSVFAFSFSLMIGVLWEIFEFSGDQLFNMDMQKDGLNDTMWDFIVNTIGAAVAALIGYFYLTPHTPETPLDPVLEKVVEKNR